MSATVKVHPESIVLEPPPRAHPHFWQRQHFWLEWGVGIFAFALALSTMLLFVMNTIADRVDTLIKEQNTAALKLSNNLRYFDTHGWTADLSVPPGLLSDLVEFSRKTRIIRDEVHRLRSLERILTVGIAKQSPPGVLPSVEAGIKANKIWDAGVEQISSYQSVRDSSQETCTSYKDMGGAICIYLFPLFYALLGAGLWHLQCHVSGEAHRSAFLRGARYTIAMIAGAVIGIINLNSLSLPPLLVSFLFGYSADIFIVRLDSLLDKLRMTAATGNGGMPQDCRGCLGNGGTADRHRQRQ